ncbi:MAG: DUF5709 domain-containing protein [Nostocoides sp.]
MTDSDGVDRDELQDSSESDDESVSPPDMMPRATEWGTTAEEQQQGETINQRIAQEVPDPDSAYGAPDNESGLDGPAPVGGDDPDAIEASDDWLGDDAGDGDAGRLVSDDAGERSDIDAQDWGTDIGADGGDESPEESAMHVVDGDTRAE